MKEFKSKNIKKKKKLKRKIKLFIFAFFFFFSYVFMVKYCINHSLNKDILDKNINYYNPNIIKIIEANLSENINKPITFLNSNIKKAIKIETKKTSYSKKSETSKVIENNKVNEYLPIVYIYNTHQTENYSNYSVYDAAKYLNERLIKNNVSSYFEEQSITAFLQDNNLKYYKSYTVSRKYMNEAVNKYSSLNYFFDIHRDSIGKDKSTITYNNKNYAKILFVIGLDNNENEKNKSNAIKLNNIIETKIPHISRGVISHGGKGYNGVYNQDLSQNVFLIEVGGKDNTKEEVENTINIIGESIIEYIGGIL